MACCDRQGTLQTKTAFHRRSASRRIRDAAELKGDSQGRGNSGVFLQGLRDSGARPFENPTYADGQAAAIYGQ